MDVKGFVEKFCDGKKVAMDWDEANQVIHGNFLGVGKVNQLQAVPEVFSCVSNINIAFTLRETIWQKELLRPYAKKPPNFQQGFSYETGPLKENVEVAVVHGLLTITNEQVPSLLECVNLLAKVFPNNLITWANYCDNVNTYRSSCLQ